MRNEHIFRSAIPAIITLLMFVLATYFIFIPFFENSVMDQKRKMVKELTSSMMATLSHYEYLEREGEMTREEAQNAAIEHIRSVRYGDTGEDYFWINDMQARMVMHPYRTDLEGKSVANFQDTNNKRLFVTFVDVAKRKGEGFVDYMWQKRGNVMDVAPKLSYVKLFKPWGWILGTGMYIEDVQASLVSLKDRVENELLFTFLAALILTIVVIYSGVHAERVVRRSEHKFHGVFNQTAHFMALLEPDGTVSDVNGAALREAKLHKKETVGKNFLDVDWWQGADQEIDKVEEALELARDGGVAHLTTSLDDRGVKIFADFSIKPMLNSKGEVSMLVVEGWDITDFKNKEMGLSKGIDNLYSLYNSTGEMIVVFKENGLVLDVNDELKKRLGYSYDEIVEMKIADFSPREYREDIESWPARIKANHEIDDVVTFVTRDDEKFIAEASVSKGSWGGQDVLFGFFRDIAHRKVVDQELKNHELELEKMVESRTREVNDVNDILEEQSERLVRLQKQVRAQERLASLGSLSAGIAHEIKNFLNFINNSGQMIKTVIRRMEKVVEDLSHKENSLEESDMIRRQLTHLKNASSLILRYGKSLDKIVQTMYAQARTEESVMAVVDLRKTVDMGLKYSYHSMRARSPFSIRPQVHLENIGSVEVYADDLERALINIIDNAFDSLYEKIQSMEGSGEEFLPELNISLDQKDANAEITIRDNGIGIPEEVRPTIFDPFVTTKPPGKGKVGLGLAIANEIISKHDGEILVKSKEGEFSEMKVVIPIRHSEEQQKAS